MIEKRDCRKKQFGVQKNYNESNKIMRKKIHERIELFFRIRNMIDRKFQGKKIDRGELENLYRIREIDSEKPKKFYSEKN